jgi:hypothetical protein
VAVSTGRDLPFVDIEQGNQKSGLRGTPSKKVLRHLSSERPLHFEIVGKKKSRL